MFKVALNAGHYMGQSGKRCLSSIDPKETREWWLNDRVCLCIEKALMDYDGYTLLRIDDPAGQKNITLADRIQKANEYGADVYLSIHHNEGQNGDSGGGAVVYASNRNDESSRQLQKLCYDKLVEATGLKGNRTEPMPTANFSECRDTKMPAVLIECGYMDSASDTPIILSREFAEKAAKALSEAVAEFGNLKAKPKPQSMEDKEEAPLEQNEETLEQTPQPQDSPAEPQANPVPDSATEPSPVLQTQPVPALEAEPEVETEPDPVPVPQPEPDPVPELEPETASLEESPAGAVPHAPPVDDSPVEPTEKLCKECDAEAKEQPKPDLGKPNPEPKAAAEPSVFGIVMNGEYQPVKAKPSLFAKKIGEIGSGQKVTIIERNGKWYKIEYNGAPAFTTAKKMVITGNL